MDISVVEVLLCFSFLVSYHPPDNNRTLSPGVSAAQMKGSDGSVISAEFSTACLLIWHCFKSTSVCILYLTEKFFKALLWLRIWMALLHLLIISDWDWHGFDESRLGEEGKEVLPNCGVNFTASQWVTNVWLFQYDRFFSAESVDFFFYIKLQ